MKRHDGEQQREPAEEGQPARSGVDADDAPIEQIPGEQEMHCHELMAPVVAHQGVEQRREIDDVERAHEQHERGDRIRQERRERRVHHAHNPFPQPRRRARRRTRQHPQRQGDRRPEDQQHRHEHVQRHVLDHVDAEHRRTIGPHPRAGRHHQRRAAGKPGHRPAGRPPISPPAQPHHPQDICAREDKGRYPEEGVEAPERRQPPRRRGTGQLIAQKDVEDRRLRGQQPGRGLNRHRRQGGDRSHRDNRARDDCPGATASHRDQVTDHTDHQRHSDEQAEPSVSRPDEIPEPGPQCQQD